MSGLTTPQITYRPFRYPEAYEFWQRQQQTHWIQDEVPLAEDIKDWNTKLTPEELNLITHIFRFFTQSDVEVNDCYHRNYLMVFRPTEVAMMLTAFSNMETIHISAYAYLLDTIGMPETEYSAFLEYEEMLAKHDFLQSFGVEDPYEVAKTLAVFGGFTEGLQLFASFAILLNFPRFNKMKGMGQIVTWSVRDESLHCEGITWLFKEWLKEHPNISREKLYAELAEICLEVIDHEDAFIDLAFEMGAVQGLTAEEVKAYIRYIARLRCAQLGIPESTLRELSVNNERFKDLIPNPVDKNPIPWLNEILNGVEHSNFFEARSTEYSKGATVGNFADVWREVDEKSAS